MNIIKVLASNITDKIAAGEVIQRPASVVKELVENSIDAGSTQIHVLFKDGGKEYIAVTDDGHGIGADDLKIALKSHATSKIENVDDLFRLSSLGFRGEALASIAAVSKIKVSSRQKNAVAGMMIESHGGQEIDYSPVGTSPGTKVEVSDLFYNIPARKKYLKNTNREAAFIVEQIFPLALAYPHIKFQVVHKREIVNTAGTGKVLRAWGDLFGHEKAQNFIVLPPTKIGHITMEMYLGTPALAQASSKGIFLFVNKRPFYNRAILSAFFDLYKEYIPHRRLPQVLLFLEINPVHIDVNVHPTKKEISLSNLGFILEQIKAVGSSLLQQYLGGRLHQMQTFSDIRSFAKPPGKDEESKPQKEKPFVNSGEPQDPPKTGSLFVQTPESGGAAMNGRPAGVEETLAYDFSGEVPKPTRAGTPHQVVMPAIEDITRLAQFYNSFIFLETVDNLFIIDQHAAHERIMYNKVLNDFMTNESNSQPLLTPLVIHLDAVENEIKNEIVEYMRGFNFILADFGANSLILREVPAYLPAKEEAPTICRDLIKEFAMDKKRSGPADLISQSLMTIACHSSIKAGGQLDKSEIIALIKELHEAQNNTTCPHGRPLIKVITRAELNNYFAR